MTEQATAQLLQDLQDESDLCRNEGATDIANLLDRAIAALNLAQKGAAKDRKDAERLREANSLAFDLTAKLCAVGVVHEKDGFDLIRRESVMELVTRWRMQWDAAMQTKEQG